MCFTLLRKILHIRVKKGVVSLPDTHKIIMHLINGKLYQYYGINVGAYTETQSRDQTSKYIVLLHLHI